MTICRGCCCGTDRKHPDIDHDAHLRHLRERLSDTATIQTSSCLGSCQHSNVIVVTPSAAGKRTGARSRWLGWVLDIPAIDAIAEWVRAGGPGLAPLPLPLQLHQLPTSTAPLPDAQSSSLLPH